MSYLYFKKACVAGAFLAAAMASLPACAESWKEALASAYGTHPRLKAQREALQILDEDVAQAVSGWRPSASLAFQRGRQRTSFEDSEWSYSDKNVRQLTVSQPLFSGGQTWADTQSAKALVKSGRAELLATEQDVLLDAVAAYMDVVQAQSVLDLNRKNENVLKEQRKAAGERFAVGEVTRTDVAQADARVALAESDRIQAEGALESARAAYKRVIGVDAVNVALPDALPETPASVQAAENAALASNPLVLAAKHREVSADYDVDSRVGALLPSLSLDASLRKDEGTGVSGASRFDTDAVLMNLTIPLYRSGADHSRVRSAKDRRQQRKFEQRDAEDEARRQAVQAWENLQTARATISSNRSAIAAAQIALDGVKQEHQYGSRTTLDVLDAEQELFQTQVNMVRSQRNEIVALFNLLSVAGQLNAASLKLPVEQYDPDEHYDDVKYQLLGF